MVARVSALLRELSQHEPDGASTSALARAVGLPRPTVHRLLTSLQGEGFADRTGDGHWLLGPELFLLGSATTTRYDVTEQARPVVRRLAQTTGESAFFSARRGDETVCLVREDGSFPIRSFVLHEGVRFPLGVASAGLAILAYLPEPDAAAYLDRADLSAHGPAHARGPLTERLAATRRDGWATNPGLIVPGSWGMGAAVFDRNGDPRWALSLTGIEPRFADDVRPRLGRLLLAAAHELTRRLRT
jgi:DNA-binding IclR family transcriptional regulator